MLAPRRRWAAVVLLTVGWVVSAWVAPFFVAFARDRLQAINPVIVAAFLDQAEQRSDNRVD